MIYDYNKYNELIITSSSKKDDVILKLTSILLEKDTIINGLIGSLSTKDIFISKLIKDIRILNANIYSCLNNNSVNSVKSVKSVKSYKSPEEYLNYNYKAINFDMFLSNIDINMSSLLDCFKLDKLNTCIIEQVIDLLSKSNTLPIRCYKKKKNTFYAVFNSIWRELKDNEINNFINLVQRNLYGIFTVWSKENEQLTYTDDEVNNIFIKNNIKLTSIINNTLIKKLLFNYLIL